MPSGFSLNCLGFQNKHTGSSYGGVTASCLGHRKSGLMTSINTHLNAPKYPECIPRNTQRVRALYVPTTLLHTAATAAPLTL